MWVKQPKHHRYANTNSKERKEKKRARENSKIPPRTTNRFSRHPSRRSRGSGMVTRRRSTSRRSNPRAIMTVAILFSLRCVRRVRGSKVTTIGTCIGLIRVFLDVRVRRFGKHGLGCLVGFTAHFHIRVLLAQSAALTPTRHGRKGIFIERLSRGRSIETCILWLLGAVDGSSGRLVLCIVRELRDWGWWLCVSLIAVVAVAAAGSAARETRQAAAAALDAAAETAYQTPCDGNGYHHADDDADDHWPSGEGASQRV